MTSERHVAVIGGGIVGLASAYYLRQAGMRVTLVDQGRIGEGCSHRNCGLVCPSHVLPLAEPGAVVDAIRSIIRPQSPLRIRPRIDASFWQWSWNFARRCNTSSMIESGSAIQPLLRSSMLLYDQLVAKGDIECEWTKRGLLFVYKHHAAFEKYASTNELMSARFNESARRMDAQELHAFEPALREDLAGGWFFVDDAHLSPERLLMSLRARLAEQGVRIPIISCPISDCNQAKKTRNSPSGSVWLWWTK